MQLDVLLGLQQLFASRTRWGLVADKGEYHFIQLIVLETANWLRVMVGHP